MENKKTVIEVKKAWAKPTIQSELSIDKTFGHPSNGGSDLKSGGAS